MVNAAVTANSSNGRAILSSFLYTCPSYWLIRIVRYDTDAPGNRQYPLEEFLWDINEVRLA